MTREIQLTQGKVVLVDDEDYEWLSRRKWCAVQTGPDGYKIWYAARRERGIDGGQHTILMHRIILGLTNGEHTDHINGDGLDNRRANLRKCTRSQNMQNAQKHINRMPFTSIYKGVRCDRNKWVASIRTNGKTQELGRYPTELAAALAYNEAALKHYGEFARLNEIEG